MRHLFTLLLALSAHLSMAQGPCDSLAAENARMRQALIDQRIELDGLTMRVDAGASDLENARKEAQVLRGLMKSYLVTIDSLVRLDRATSEAVPFPIDVEMDRCLADTAHFTTYSMMQCVGAATEAWQAELDTHHTALMARLSPEGRTALGEAQQQWLAFNEKQIALNGQVYYTELQGTMYRLSAALSNMERIKERALELKSLLDALEEQ